MLRWLRRQHAFALAATLAAMLAWLGAAGAQVVHQVTAVHEVCADHGELVEGSAPDAPDDDGAEADHRHGCEVGGLVTSAVPEPPPVASTEAPWSPQQPVVLLLACELAPRGPPLAYAPKTSPPSLLG